MSARVLGTYKRLVIKVGSSLLVGDDGQLNLCWLQSLVDDVAESVSNGAEVVIVSSGAIAIGARALDIDRRRARLSSLQAAAAAGQVKLVHAYQNAFDKHNQLAAQVLLTFADTENRRQFLNARATLTTLLERDVVPVVNENDTTATEEIRFGDNDRLAARVAQLIMADGLLLLSDVDGLYSSDPTLDQSARHIPIVNSIGDDVLAMAGISRSDVGSGGMRTKILAAQIAVHAGCSTFIASGKILHPLRALDGGGKHTVFRATATPAAMREQWLAGAQKISGQLSVDDGAVDALTNGRSLLPVGVFGVSGNFSRGDIVALLDSKGGEIGRGLAEYSSEEMQRLCGCHSDEIEAVLGYRGRSVVVHSDELVVFRNGND